MATKIENLNIMGEALLQTDNAEGALVAYNSALELESTNKTALVGKTISLLELGRAEEASRQAYFTTQKYPDVASFWDLLGETALISGEVELAVRAFSQYQKLNKSNPSNIIKLAEAYYLAQDIDSARNFISLAMREEPENQDARIWQEKLAGIKDKASLLIDIGKSHLKQGRVQQGVELFRQALSLGDSISARLELGRGLIVLNQIPEAIAHLKSAKERDKGNPEVFLELAKAYLLSGERETARELYIETLRMSPTNLDAFIGMAELSIDIGSLDEAESYLEQSIRLDSSKPEAWMLKAQLHMARGEKFQARRSADHAIVLDINSVTGWKIGEEILRKQDMLALADYYLDKVRKLVPGQIKIKQGPSKEIMESVEIDSADLERLSDPREYSEVCRERIIIYVLIDMPEWALHYIMLLRKKCPQYADEQIISQQGILLMTMGKPLEARECFQQVLKINSANKVAQFWLNDIATNSPDNQPESSNIQLRVNNSEKKPAQKIIKAKPGPPDNKVKVVSSDILKVGKESERTAIYCRRCGNKFSNTAKFCNKCGAPRK